MGIVGGSTGALIAHPWLCGGAGDDEIAALLIELVAHKEAGHCIGQPDFAQPARAMTFIGG